ncbi:hypothetical protein FRAHR75_1560005 [Frankia sp. Hr75.2]|nr:hypothetical protein FRAHR75_1560005 [Frankia sp. Hr75.2]SQD98660.1 hypothetical protein FMEAI12_4850017 [Parafrankia sp. Ea1.12]
MKQRCHIRRRGHLKQRRRVEAAWHTGGVRVTRPASRAWTPLTPRPRSERRRQQRWKH